MSSNTTSIASGTSSTSSMSAPTTNTAPATTSSAGSTSSAPATTSTSADLSSIASSISSEVSSSLVSPTPSSTTTVEPTTTRATSTSIVTESTVPPSTAVVTSVITASEPGQSSGVPTTIVVTATRPASTVAATVAGSSSATGDSTSSAGPALNTGSNQNKGSDNGGGLSTAGVTAVAVVVPVVVVALLVLGGIFFWRKRKQKKVQEEQRRKEIEEYGFNPNNDPTLPTVASENGNEMSEDHSSGYRGWGAATGSNRKMSTTLSGGHTQGQLSDAGSNPYNTRGNPASTGASDGHSGDPLVMGGMAGHQRNETMNSDDLGALGHGPAAGTAAAGTMKRGPSNASSTYSAGNHSDVSDGAGAGGMSQSYEAYNPNGFGYSQHGPYGDGTYGGAGDVGDNGMPIVRDVSARRNTRIQQPGNYQQGNSGIAQNF